MGAKLVNFIYNITIIKVNYKIISAFTVTELEIFPGGTLLEVCMRIYILGTYISICVPMPQFIVTLQYLKLKQAKYNIIKQDDNLNADVQRMWG